MAVIVPSDGVYATAAGSTAILTSVLAMLILIHHCYKVNKHVRKSNITVSNSIMFSIILPVIIVVQSGIFETWVYWIKVENQISCRIAVIYGNAGFYILSEWALYMLLSFRVGMYCGCFNVFKFQYLCKLMMFAFLTKKSQLYVHNITLDCDHNINIHT